MIVQAGLACLCGHCEGLNVGSIFVASLVESTHRVSVKLSAALLQCANMSPFKASQ